MNYSRRESWFDTSLGKIVSGGVLLLLTVNGFFISRLVANLDADSEKIENHGDRLVRLETKIDAIDKKIDSLIDEQKSAFFSAKKKSTKVEYKNAFNQPYQKPWPEF